MPAWERWVDGLLKQLQGATVQRTCLTLPPQPWQEDPEQAPCILPWHPTRGMNGKVKIYEMAIKNIIRGESWKLMFKSICHFIIFFFGKIKNQIAHIWLRKSTFLAILNLHEIFSKYCFPSPSLWGKLDTSFR